MLQDQLTHLVGLGLAAVVAIGSVWLLLRPGGNRAQSQVDGMLVGYPPPHFPAQDIACSEPLAALAATQARLLTLYQQLPSQSDLAIWLRLFLIELREVMDTSYRVAVITRLYHQPHLFDRLVREVQEFEAQVAEHIAHRLLARDGDAQAELLEGRLATLRLCVGELASQREHGATFLSS